MRGHEARDQSRIVQTAVAVVDALDMQIIDSTRHVIGWTFLAGMGDEPETLTSRAFENAFELGRRVAALGRIEPDADNLVAIG